MDKQLLKTKLAQLLHILLETQDWLNIPVKDFSANTLLVRACQRNLQLLVEYGSDINGLFILEQGKKSPGSYKESFSLAFHLPAFENLSEADRKFLLESAELRNKLIHEYEPKEKNEVFYKNLKNFLTAYKNCAKAVNAFLGSD